jgi:hypothetical protein
MREITIYSTVCACCNRAVLSNRPIFLSGTGIGVTSLYGGPFVFHPGGSDELCDVVLEDGLEMRMLPRDAEEWLIREALNDQKDRL